MRIISEYIGNREWIKYMFNICESVSKKSKDPSTKVGCVITNSANSIISTGYNGFPIGVKDDINKSGIDKRYERPLKYMFTSHAEENAIALAARNGVKLEGSSLYVNRMVPCTRCTRLIIQSGIKNIFVYEDAPRSTLNRWEDEYGVSETMIKEAKIKLFIFNSL